MGSFFHGEGHRNLQRWLHAAGDRQQALRQSGDCPGLQVPGGTAVVASPHSGIPVDSRGSPQVLSPSRVGSGHPMLQIHMHTHVPTPQPACLFCSPAASFALVPLLPSCHRATFVLELPATHSRTSPPCLWAQGEAEVCRQNHRLHARPVKPA